MNPIKLWLSYEKNLKKLDKAFKKNMVRDKKTGVWKAKERNKMVTNYQQIRNEAEIKLSKRFKRIYSYFIEDVSKESIAWGVINGKRVRMFLQKDGTFATGTGLSRKEFKTKFFAKRCMKKYKDVRLIMKILYHSKFKDFEDFTEEWIVREEEE